ncbi:hypothetical protein H920_07434 [Fukomys damarensis]|uniref:Uncharacterized protein n=1 Tax=Fukomys damarensis TaxID=885580 RepID=A0A091DLJ7_FUKDA|nr:hypothetical protein H920_07434 [Fukomys damarensis]
MEEREDGPSVVGLEEHRRTERKVVDVALLRESGGEKETDKRSPQDLHTHFLLLPVAMTPHNSVVRVIREKLNILACGRAEDRSRSCSVWFTHVPPAPVPSYLHVEGTKHVLGRPTETHPSHRPLSGHSPCIQESKYLSSHIRSACHQQSVQV